MFGNLVAPATAREALRIPVPDSDDLQTMEKLAREVAVTLLNRKNSNRKPYGESTNYGLAYLFLVCILLPLVI